MAGMLRRFRPLQAELKAYLKTKLPSYAIPTHFIPLQRLPLNPNGKVDKPALPFPDIADMTASKAEDWASRTKTEQLLADIWGSLIPSCNPSSLNSRDSFFDIGGHSISAQQLLLTIKRNFKGIKLSMAELFRHSTLRGLASAIDRARHPDAVLAGSDGQYRQANDYTNGHLNGNTHQDEDYSGDARKLARDLPRSFPSVEQLDFKKPLEIFLTGNTSSTKLNGLC